VSELPLMLHGDGIEALVVGGGPVAARKTRSLLAAGARVRVVAMTPGSEIRALGAAFPRLTIEDRAYASGDVGAAQLVIAATDDAAVNRRVAADAHASHRMVNVADDPARGNCRTTATHRAGALVIGISAGGVPRAATRIRDSLAMRFDGRYGTAVATLASLRRRLLDSARGADWRLAASTLLDERFCERVESGAFQREADEWR
jgi:precorrin-2 dehydrogenase / sirohydrochlorin ferrochelatase